MKMRVGLVGMRGMVGSVLLQRMLEENDFAGIEPIFFSSSQVGKPAPHFERLKYHDAYDLEELQHLDVILTCQGSGYTEKVYPALRKQGWEGYFIDASSHLRLHPDAQICLDPVNHALLEEALEQGVRTFVGGNCTVSLMLMVLSEVLRSGEVEYLTSSTYQAASGVGMQAITALLRQMQELSQHSDPDFQEMDKALHAYFNQDYSDQPMGGLLAGSLLPWIDSDLGQGVSREEAKMLPETLKIMSLGETIPMDTICVRVGVLRCHSQSITLKMKSDWSIERLEETIRAANPWAKVIPNQKEMTLEGLTPASISGTLNVAAGRIRKLNLPGHYYNLFTVGDQLLWGAAEPLRRMLKIIRKREKR